MPEFPGINSRGELFAGLAASKVRDTLGLGAADDVTFNEVTAGRFIGDGSQLTNLPGVNTAADYLWSGEHAFGDDVSVFMGGDFKLGVGSELLAYNLDTDASNYERAYAKWDGVRFEMGTEYAGTGSDRDFAINARQFVLASTNGTTRFRISTSHIDCRMDVEPNIDNGRALGATAARWSNVYATQYRNDGTNPPSFPEGSEIPAGGSPIRIYNNYTDAANNDGLEISAVSSQIRFKAFENGTGTAPRYTFAYEGGTYFFLQNQKAEWYCDVVPVTDTYSNIGLGSTSERWNRVCAVDFQNDGIDPPRFPDGIQATLPTSDPAVAGQLWNDSGTVKISAG